MHNEKPLTVLAIDDEESNLKIIYNDLEDAGYLVLCARDGIEGWEVLQTHKDDISVILLDRMMPNMDGMEFMQKLRADESVRRIPVIMQSAASDRQQILEGIQAGAYYYLTKPYEYEMLISIVKSAIHDYEKFRSLFGEVELFKRQLQHVQESRLEIRTIDEARDMAVFLASHYPKPERVSLGVWEMLLNAVEHGNAGIKYHEKSALLVKNQWEEEVLRRLDQPENLDKRVRIYFKRSSERIDLTIRDEGAGFKWQDYLTIDPARATDNHGRGIALAAMMSFDEITYQGCGNEVVCSVTL